VDTAAGKPDQRIAGLDVTAVNQRVMFDHSDTKAGKIIIALGIHPGHLSRLTTDEPGTGLATALGNATDNLLGGVHIQLAGGVVVKKEKRLGAGDDDIVDAHGNQIDTDAIVLPGLKGKAQFGADTVCAGDQDGSAITLHRQLEKPAKAAESAQHARTMSGGNIAFDALDQLSTGIDINTGVPVTQAFFVICRTHAPLRLTLSSSC